MPPLSTHFRDPQSHGRLAFHADCPICRDERLLGSTASPAVMSQRTGAAMAAAVLAVTTVGPAAAFAAEPDHESEGATEQSEGIADDGSPPAAGDRAQHDAFYPDEGATGLPADAAQDDDAAPDDAAPDPDDRAPAAGAPNAQDGRDQPPGPAGPPARPPAQPQPPPEAPAADPAPPAPPAPPAQGQPSPAARGSATPRAPRARAIRAARSRARTALIPRRARAQQNTVAPTAPSAPAQPDAAQRADPPAPARARTSTAPATADVADPGDRTHTVQAGESLWSIAGDILGPGARPLQIAREVHRLWELNKDRIATGDPDLLLTGTRLRLR